jgi:hypothetical protein
MAVAATPAPVAAPVVHDADRTQVEVRFFAERSFQIDVMNPPAWLITTLDPLSDTPSSTILTGEARDRRIAELMPRYAEWIWILFDGVRQEAHPEFIPVLRRGPVNDSLPPSLVTVRLRGQAPDTAQQLSFAFGLIIDPYPITAIQSSGEPTQVWVTGPVESDKMEIASLLPPPWYRTILTYVKLGYEHILPKGADHILFAIGIFLLGASFLPLLAQVTTFTIAHSIALALTLFGVITLRPAIVGPMIGLSIAYLASENLFKVKLERGRLALVFVLGLLFGTGFAGALTLPTSDHAAALASYNLGIEAAQLTVIAAMFLLVGWCRKKEWYRRRVVLPMSALVGVLGLYLTVARLFGS